MSQMAKKKHKQPDLVIIGREEIQEQAQQIEQIKPDINFDAWWVLKAQSLKLKPEMKSAVMKHFEARGFMESGDFDNGIIDFGI